MLELRPDSSLLGDPIALVPIPMAMSPLPLAIFIKCQNSFFPLRKDSVLKQRGAGHL